MYSEENACEKDADCVKEFDVKNAFEKNRFSVKGEFKAEVEKYRESIEKDIDQVYKNVHGKLKVANQQLDIIKKRLIADAEGFHRSFLDKLESRMLDLVSQQENCLNIIQGNIKYELDSLFIIADRKVSCGPKSKNCVEKNKILNEADKFFDKVKVEVINKETADHVDKITDYTKNILTKNADDAVAAFVTKIDETYTKLIKELKANEKAYKETVLNLVKELEVNQEGKIKSSFDQAKDNITNIYKEKEKETVTEIITTF